MPRPFHVGGIAWWEAKVPRRWHRCREQTSGWVEKSGGFCFMMYCACGAHRDMTTSGKWEQKNWRRQPLPPYYEGDDEDTDYIDLE